VVAAGAGGACGVCQSCGVHRGVRPWRASEVAGADLLWVPAAYLAPDFDTTVQARIAVLTALGRLAQAIRAETDGTADGPLVVSPGIETQPDGVGAGIGSRSRSCDVALEVQAGEPAAGADAAYRPRQLPVCSYAALETINEGS